VYEKSLAVNHCIQIYLKAAHKQLILRHYGCLCLVLDFKPRSLNQGAGKQEFANKSNVKS